MNTTLTLYQLNSSSWMYQLSSYYINFYAYDIPQKLQPNLIALARDPIDRQWDRMKNSNVNTTKCSEEFCAFHPWQMQVCFFAGSCQACDKMNGLINEMDMHEMAQLAKIHIENSFSVVSDGSVN